MPVRKKVSDSLATIVDYSVDQMGDTVEFDYPPEIIQHDLEAEACRGLARCEARRRKGRNCEGWENAPQHGLLNSDFLIPHPNPLPKGEGGSWSALSTARPGLVVATTRTPACPERGREVSRL